MMGKIVHPSNWSRNRVKRLYMGGIRYFRIYLSCLVDSHSKIVLQAGIVQMDIEKVASNT